MYREILKLYKEDKKISYHYHSSPYIIIKKFVPHPFYHFVGPLQMPGDKVWEKN